MKIIFLLLILGVGLYVIMNLKGTNSFNHVTPPPTPRVSSNPSVLPAHIGTRTKTTECQSANGLPDSACTPGMADPSLTKEVLCSPSFTTKSIRNVSSEVKAQVYKEYGIVTHKPGEYEVDHLISLELGGSNDIANLWPEAAEPRPGFHEKDMVENYLHDHVCNGLLSLAEAQSIIASNWLSLYQSLQKTK